jgi:4-hydroxybenzoate polyprenyltransferase
MRLNRRYRPDAASGHQVFPAPVEPREPSPLPARRFPGPVVRVIRPYQWVKNLLLFVPAIGAHRILEPATLTNVLVGVIAFSCCASAIYVVNDLLDIASDRLHPRKRLRPFAAGELSVPTGVAVSAALLVSAFVIAAVALPFGMVLVLAAYVLLNLAYSLQLKRQPVTDVFLLTGFYVLRIFAGGIATGIPLSTWLLAFAMFFFLNLALVKRFAELTLAAASGHDIPGRGYVAGDVVWMQTVGPGAGYMAVVVLAIYTTQPDVTALYTTPIALMWLCPLLLYYVSRIWLRAMRQMIHDDPVIETLRDPASYVVGLGCLVILLLAL